MSRWTLADLSKLPPGIQKQIYPHAGVPDKGIELSSPVPSDKTPPASPEAPPPAIPEPSALDMLPVYVPTALLRHILDNFAGPFYCAETETQRRKVVDHAVQCLAARDARPAK